MKKVYFFIIYFYVIFFINSCKSIPSFTEEEISEYNKLCVELSNLDFSYGKKYGKNQIEVKLYKVNENPFSIDEFYISLNDYSKIKRNVNYVQKTKNIVFIKFSATYSGWCKGVLYTQEEKNLIMPQAEVLIKIDDCLYYFEGKS